MSKDTWTQGTKFDHDKTRYELLAPEFLEGVAQVLTFGARKYEDRNWEKGIYYSRVFGAAMRHLWAWWRGEKDDPESGLPHLHHAACCVQFLITYEERGLRQCDDRPTPYWAFELVTPATAEHETHPVYKEPSYREQMDRVSALYESDPEAVEDTPMNPPVGYPSL